MATHRISLFGILQPDTSGNVFWQPSDILDTNDLAPTPVMIFKDTATLDTAAATVPVPKNYVGTAKIVLRYKTTAITGNTLWTVDVVARADGESGDPSTWDQSLAGTATAVPGTINLLKDISFTVTATLVPDDWLLIRIGRNGAGADTVAASLQLVDAAFEYADV